MSPFQGASWPASVADLNIESSFCVEPNSSSQLSPAGLPESFLPYRDTISLVREEGWKCLLIMPSKKLLKCLKI